MIRLREIEKIFYLLIISSVLLAAPVNIEIAQRVASHIYAERSSVGSTGFVIQSVDVIDKNSVNVIYLFHLESLNVLHLLL